MSRTNRTDGFRPVLLVTGCTSGVGLELARILARLPQYRTVVTGRALSLAPLRRELPENDHFMILDLDVTSAKSRAKTLATIRERWGEIDLLINNAGISFRSVVEDMDDQDEELQMATNYFGAMGLIREVLPAMRAKGRGKIINVSSVSGMLAMPTMASYSASKHALEGASEALWYEMKPFGINVCLVQPGFIHSQSFERVYFSQRAERGHKDPQLPYADYYQSMGPFIRKLMGLSWTTAHDVAKKILWCIQTENPPLWVPATPDAIIFNWLRRSVPRRWLMPILFFFLPNSKHWALRHSFRRPQLNWSRWIKKNGRAS